MGGNGHTDDPRVGPTLYVIFIGLVLFVAICLGLTAYFRTVEKGEQYTKVVMQGPADLTQLLTEQRAQLAGYRWLDPRQGRLAIPIDRAMELIVEEYRWKER